MSDKKLTFRIPTAGSWAVKSSESHSNEEPSPPPQGGIPASSSKTIFICWNGIFSEQSPENFTSFGMTLAVSGQAGENLS